uniref:Uncharacterized protein n=1 Tax=Romanomermis culicivorax TaxID=13658 RepID=A0A915KIX0_ROMCU
MANDDNLNMANDDNLSIPIEVHKLSSPIPSLSVLDNCCKVAVIGRNNSPKLTNVLCRSTQRAYHQKILKCPGLSSKNV